jgi:hypothetical protein
MSAAAKERHTHRILVFTETKRGTDDVSTGERRGLRKEEGAGQGLGRRGERLERERGSTAGARKEGGEVGEGKREHGRG